MPVDTLVNMVKQEWWDALGGVALPLGDDVLEEIIRESRLIEPRRALAGLNEADQQRRARAWIDEVNGQLTLTLVDLTGTRSEYGHGYTYYLYPDPPAVYVNGELCDPQPEAYAWKPFSLGLIFTSPLEGVNPLVQVKGHLVDLNAAYARTGEMFLTQVSTLVSVKSDEYDELARKVQRRVNHYKTKTIKRPAR